VNSRELAHITAPPAVLYSLAVLLDMSFGHIGHRIVVIQQTDMADYNKNWWSWLEPRVAWELANHTRVADMTAGTVIAPG